MHLSNFLIEAFQPLRDWLCAMAALVVATGIRLYASLDHIPAPGNALARALLLAMVCDLTLGVIWATWSCQLSWAGLSKGIRKTIIYGVMILFSVALDYAARGAMSSLALPFFSLWVLGYLVFRELVSVTDTLEKLGFPMPQGLRNWLRQMQRHLDQCPPGTVAEAAPGTSTVDGKKSSTKEDRPA